MALTSDQVRLIQSSFLDLNDAIDSLATAFYARLFELNPQLRSLFKGDMRTQRWKLTQQLLMLLIYLRHPDSLMEATRGLGQRHVRYGVQQEDYATVGEALLWALECVLGEKFTPEVKEAWKTAYLFVAYTAIEAGYEHQPGNPE